MHNKNKNYNIYFTYGILIVGILTGCIFVLIAMFFDNRMILDMGLEDYKISVVLNVSTSAMVLYIIKKRLMQFFLFAIFIYLFSYNVSASIFCGGFGVYYGMVLTNLIIKYSLTGFLYGLACFFPHYLCYFLIIVLLGKWNTGSLNFYYKNMKYLICFSKIFVIFLLILISLTWEIRFQKNFLNYFFQHLV